MSALLVDLDGTLVRLPVDWDAVRADLRAAAARLGLDLPFRSLTLDLTALPARARALGWDAVRIRATREELHGRIRERELAAVPAATAVAGAADLLAWAQEHAVPLAIVSSNSVATVHAVFERFGWRAPQAVVGRESVEVPKPSPEGARFALERMGAIAERAIVIGDSDHDVLVGRALGSRTIRVVADPADGSHERADIEVAGLAEARAALER